MKREIKFRRAYFTDEQCSKFSHFGTGGVGIESMAFKNPATNNFAEYFIDQQFTGLKDKNGVELYYDSDIVRLAETWMPDFDPENKWLWIAAKDDFDIPHFLPAHGAFGVSLPFESVFMRNRFGFEIVGNKFANPELLNDVVVNFVDEYDVTGITTDDLKALASAYEAAIADATRLRTALCDAIRRRAHPQQGERE